MNEGLIARRYALAMLKVAEKQKAAEELYELMKQFEQNYVAHPDLRKALGSPVLSPRDKENLLTTAIGLENPGDLFLRGIRLVPRRCAPSESGYNLLSLLASAGRGQWCG